MRRVRYEVARLQDMRPDHGQIVSLGATGECLLVLNGGHCFAVGSLCPHQNASLDQATAESGQLICPRHRYRFDLKSGECLTTGGYGLPTFETSVEDGTIYVACWEFDEP